MITSLQKLTTQAIINIFETGRIQGDYGRVTLLEHDTGHLTYGRSQTTLASGNLYLLIKSYCDADAAEYSADLKPYLERLGNLDLTLDHDQRLRNILRNAGDDPVMHTVQDAFFDRVYWEPALKSADYIGAETGLGTTVVYDSRIHGSWHAIRDQTNTDFGSLSEIGERAWFEQYVAMRRHWLATHSNTGLHATVYRMESLQELIESDNWDLLLPLTIRGIMIDQTALESEHLPSPRAEVSQHLTLKLESPFMQGEDVRRLQEALISRGADIDPDGVFGGGTDKALRLFQSDTGLVVDGIAGPATQAEISP